MSKGWKNGSTTAWRSVREVVLRRDGGRCKIATPGTWVVKGETRRCLGKADCVHHTKGKTFGDDPAHLLAACTPCNLKAGDPTKQDPEPTPKTRW